MNYQEIIAYGIVVLVAIIVIKKTFFKNKKGKDSGSCGGTNCGCG